LYINKIYISILYFYWGLGIGDWGLGIGDWAQSPIPNPQSPKNFNIKLKKKSKMLTIKLSLILFYL